jgi:pimeloyl-ACP methyl ester carboxylesterase
VLASTAVSIDTAEVTLDADLAVPAGARGVVLFAHGSGSSRHSPRNRMVAEHLHDYRFATVLADLLTPGEEQVDAQTGALRFDISLLAGRMTALVDWSTSAEPLRDQPIGLFGASTGAAAALVAAAERPEQVRAVVSRGGRPDLAAASLPRVHAPTLFIVGERDHQVITLNEQAAAAMTAPHRTHIVPGATHLFEEPGALLEVADRAAQWFTTHLS